MKNICVFCGSRDGREAHRLNAIVLGSLMAKRGYNLVYGGSNLGLMGLLANTVRENGGQVTAIMPQLLADSTGHDNAAELIVTPGMHERKYQMYERADAFIAMPGGFGTDDEIFEVITWVQLGILNKPCGFLNVDGFFDHLFRYLDHSHEQGFISAEHRAIPLVGTSPAELLDLLEQRLAL